MLYKRWNNSAIDSPPDVAWLKNVQKLHKLFIYVIALFFRLYCTVQKRRNNREWERARVDTNTFDIQNMMNCPIKEKMILSIYLLLCLWTREIESYVLYYYFYFMSGIIRIIWKSQISPAAASFLKLKKKFIHPKVSKTTEIWI